MNVPIIRKCIPSLLAHDMIGVQPMKPHLGNVFYNKPTSLKYWIFLDDERHPIDVDWCRDVVKRFNDAANYSHIICRNLDDVLTSIKNNKIDHISFDHDLGLQDENGFEITGYTILKHLIDMHIHGMLSNLPTCSFHSKNPVGVENMKSYYENYLKMMEL